MKIKRCLFGWCLASLSLVSLIIGGCVSQKHIGSDTKRGESSQQFQDLKAHNAMLETLLEGLNDEDSHARALAASNLGDIAPATKDVVPALMTALNDESNVVRVSAAEALVKIKPENLNWNLVLPVLMEGFFDNSFSIPFIPWLTE